MFTLHLPPHLYPNLIQRCPTFFKKPMANRICRKYGNYRTVLPSLTSQVPVASWQILLRNNSPQIWGKNSKSQKKDVVFRGYRSFHKFNLMPHAQIGLWELTPLHKVQLPIYPPFRQVKMAQNWIAADRKPKSTQVKTYEVWLEQWVSSSPCYSSLGGRERHTERDLQKTDPLLSSPSLFRKRFCSKA